jgi:nickel-dependent lactate racemase
MDNNGDFARIVAGHWRDAWIEGCKEVMRIQGAKINARSDVVIASGGGFPRDINLYQGTKTIDSLELALKPEGIAIVVLECREMAQTVEFNNDFRFDNPLEMEKALRLSPTIDFIIAFRAFELAKKYTFFLVTKRENFELARKTGMIPCATVAEAWDLTQKELEKRGNRDYTINLMPHGATTVPLGIGH